LIDNFNRQANLHGQVVKIAAYALTAGAFRRW
jgi:hypothetical protein